MNVKPFFQTQNVCATLSVTPCWCYGSETMDLNPLTIKAVWGFNGTERPGAVYLAACMAAHAQRGLPAFAIYGKDVQDKWQSDVPESGEIPEKKAYMPIPVSMHNVSEDRIYRPHTWSAYGTKDLEAADYRACADYGPLY